MSNKRRYQDSENNEALARRRERLKVHLWGNKQWDGAWWEVVCPLCGLPIQKPDDAVMHEWLIKRSAVPKDKQLEIMHEYNCVLLHFACHEHDGQTEYAKLCCAQSHYARYGRDKIVEWVASLGLKQHVEVPE